MRITYVCADPGVPVFGTKGASVHIQEMVRALRRAGHDVRVLAIRRGDQIPPDLTDLEVVEMPLPRGITDAAEREAAVSATATVMADAIFAEPTDMIYERYSLFSAKVQLMAAERGVPSVLEVNAPLIDEQLRHRTLVHEEQAREVVRAAADAAGAVVCVSTPVRDRVLGLSPAARTLVVPNGVDTNRITPRESGPGSSTDRETRPGRAADRGPITVGFIGTLKPWHGVDVLIRAAALASFDLRLLVVGDGPEATALAELAMDNDVQVEFTGAVAPTRIPELLRRMDVAVVPGNGRGAAAKGTAQTGPAGTAEQYFSPLKMFEYAAAGLPIVAGAVGQVAELMRDRDTALLVPVGDPRALAAALDRLAADPALAARLGRSAREWVEGHSWDAVAAHILTAARRPAATRRPATAQRPEGAR